MASAKVRRGRARSTNGAVSARRSELLGIAAQLFATRGYSQTTVRDIADEAGILSGSLYHHFDSKETMLFEILHEFMTNLESRFSDIVERGDSPRATLDGLIRAAFATIHAHPHAVALYQNEAGLIGLLPEFEFVTKTSTAIEKTWLTVLTSGRKSGDFRKDLDINLVYRFIRDTVWTSVRWYNPRGKYQYERLADQYLSMLYGGLLET